MTVDRKFIYTEKKEDVIAKDKTTNIKKKTSKKCIDGTFDTKMENIR